MTNVLLCFLFFGFSFKSLGFLVCFVLSPIRVAERNVIAPSSV
jgi:hypothetical protein